jgi:hypothetical protein
VADRIRIQRRPNVIFFRHPECRCLKEGFAAFGNLLTQTDLSR